MDPAAVFHQSLGSVLPPQHFFAGRPPLPGPYPWDSPEQDSHDAPHRVAHTLTACCRCRQRKTRCDPALPRCLPCERAGATCEYYDSTKGKRISRSYVVSLQKKVRQLEAELAQFTDQDGDASHEHDDMVVPGGIVRLDETDEIPRYLGPSSGTAMTRLLMEEAKRYAESRRIANLIPAVLARRRDRMQSIVMGSSISGPSGRTKSYPAHSIIPASALPSREIVDGLVRAFNDRIQVFTPILHEKMFAEDLNAVFAGDADPYKHFVVNMVVAIGLQRVGKYAGLPDSYYLNAMRRFEDVVRPQDLKTLQCLVLISQYSLMTPTRTATYYVTGLATRICQQMGLGDERTIGVGVSDPRALDVRRRISWTVTAQEFGLANTMGRPNGFAKADDFMNVKFFETVVDEDITPEGIRPGRPCEGKMVAVHFCKMRILQAQIRRVLYEKKRPEPAHESHPWFLQMEQRLTDWLEGCPEKPAWCKPWLQGCYHGMVISLYRPSVQLPKPSTNGAAKCFESSRTIIDLTCRQIQEGTVDITWESLLTVYAALNALLWSISYVDVRNNHSREAVQDIVAAALEAIKIFSDRWPGSESAVQLYTVIANACLQSYDIEEETPSPPSSSQLGTPVSLGGPLSPESEGSRNTPTRQTQPQSATSLFNNSSPFGYVFDGSTDPLTTQFTFEDDSSPFQHQPTFRSNSIFMSPSTDGNGRRLSNLAPDSSDAHAPARMGTTPPPLLVIPKQEQSQLINTPPMNSIPTPPESLTALSAQAQGVQGSHTSPRLATTVAGHTSPMQTPTPHHVNPVPGSHQTPAPMVQVKQEPLDMYPSTFKSQQQQPPPPPQPHPRQAAQRPPPPTFITPQHPPPHPQQQSQHQPSQHPPPRPPPSHGPTDWYNPLPQFVPPNVFSAGTPPPFWNGNPNPFTGEIAPNGHQPHAPGAPNTNNSNATNWNLGFGAAPGTTGPQDGFAPPNAPPNTGASNNNHHNNTLYPGPIPGMSGDYYHHHPHHPHNPHSQADSAFLSLRQGSLSHEQQLELMDMLETDGMSDIDSFLNLGMGMGVGGVGVNLGVPGQGPQGHGGQGQGQGHGHGQGGGVQWA